VVVAAGDEFSFPSTAAGEDWTDSAAVAAGETASAVSFPHEAAVILIEAPESFEELV